MSSVLGYDELVRNLHALAQLDDDMESSIRSWAGTVRDSAKEIVPVRTGELRDSISDDYEIGIHTIDGSVFTTKEYGPDVELGIGQEAHPFLYPALYQNQADIIDGVGRDIAAGIDERVK